ncbi:MAG: alkaline phosphatase [Verrucomicrobia bacterium]|nr:alkaline phosphatase [Verrucomicrobiota bacterium]
MPSLRIQTLITLFALVILTPNAFAQVKYMVVVGVDGLSPDGILHGDAPNLKRLREKGSWTYHARGVMPTSSSPNWASMIMGAGPEQHGVTSNDWETNKFEIAPTVVGPGGIFPTIFSVLREQKPDSTLGVFHDWDGYGRLLERKMVDVVEDLDGPTNTVRRAVEFIKSRKPTFTFIHLDHVDHAGHHDGHGTPAYYASVGVADKLIGEVIAGIQEASMTQDTLVLVTADHGGKDKGHGGATMGEIEIPWIIAGPGVRVGHEIKASVNTYDTAATIAFAFKLKPPQAWIARPVREAFEKSDR